MYTETSHAPVPHTDVPQGTGPVPTVPPAAVPPAFGGVPPVPPARPRDRKRDRKRVGPAVFVTCLVAAGLLGGGAATGAAALWTDAPAQSTTTAQAAISPVIVNNTESVNAVTAAAQKASPSVVTISVSSGSSGGTGSGIILDTEGHILTNTHVVTLDGAAEDAAVEVRTIDGQVYKATIVGTDPLSDLAVIKIDAEGLTPATLGDSGAVNVGDKAIAIGAPLGLSGTVTDGIVSAVNRTIETESSATSDGSSEEGSSQNPFRSQSGVAASAQDSISINVIQTDAAINPGNSGGALVNAQGEIIGVNVAIASAGSSSSSSTQSGNIGVGFSIPINQAKRVAEEIISTGTATHGQLGLSVQDKTSGSSSDFTAGAEVASVTSGSAADKAGLKAGDVVTGLAGRTVTDASELTAAAREQAAGATVKITFQRDGEEQTADITLGAAS
ncbi:S1 family peptidase [Arthrobacter globiformis NBRC 12137]|uniref:S1 family peptidase n=1 Tax=Arthrobacter globiformis (strain ATCC 8010 / DSM 20124 / JCM 1332 / NBRC 12137 / NCIMB 8907 / NRRL B-2979 / 168) TaxID=1077972 RepID=H0QQ40_ARTG1|nr:trypsin-like peptidase domain-containing protein [Arthrobacter globiformis]GAB14941.1 S1 family peptidase [Arthrobacter globiformis NBRC 12137]